MAHWHILTGEFPPDVGGVGDYSNLFAQSLATAGHLVDVWCPFRPESETAQVSDEVKIHPIFKTFRTSELYGIWQSPKNKAQDAIVLVQYVPQRFGGLFNLKFPKLLRHLKNAGLRIWIMLHEPYYPWVWSERPQRWALSLLHREMLRQSLAVCERLFLSTDAWRGHLRRFRRCRDIPTKAIGVPSTIRRVEAPRETAALREAFRTQAALGHDAKILGTFGGYGHGILDILTHIIAGLLEADANLLYLPLGREASELHHRLQSVSTVASRVLPMTNPTPRDVSLCLQTLDVLLQPYVDGVTTRRTSTMAGLAHGRAVVTNKGYLTEGLWEELAPCHLAPSITALASATRTLLENDLRRMAQAQRGLDIYQRHFAIERTVAQLLEAL